MENRLKEQPLDLFADRTSTHWLAANQLRLWLSSVGDVMLNEVRRLGWPGTKLARADVGTIRAELCKIGALVKMSVRRVVIALSSAYPQAELFRTVLERLRAAPAYAARRVQHQSAGVNRRSKTARPESGVAQ